MEALDPSPVFVTLAELRMMGEFLRRQDLDQRLAAVRDVGRPPRGYPLFGGRLSLDDHIDVFAEPQWRKARFLGLADGRRSYSDQGETHSISYDPYRVAPAG